MLEKMGFAADQLDSVCISFDKMDKIGAEGVKAELTEKGFAAEAVQALDDFLRAAIQPGHRRRQGRRRGADRRPALCHRRQREGRGRALRHCLRPQPRARAGLLHRHGV